MGESVCIYTKFYTIIGKIAFGVNYGFNYSRKGADGKVNYRAAIRITRKGFPAFSESKTFHSKKLAENWIKKEVEIQENPDILLGKEKLIDLTLSDAIKISWMKSGASTEGRNAILCS